MIGKWKTSMWTQQFGVYSCLSHSKLQFILEEIVHWIYDPSRINLRSLWITYFGQLRSWSKSRRRSQGCPRLSGISVCGESFLLCDRAVRIMKSQTYVFSDSVLCFGRHQSRTSSRLERQKSMVFGNTLSQRIETIRWRTDGIRVEKFPRSLYIGNSQWCPKDDGRIKVWTWAISRKDHRHVHVQWHCMENYKK